MRQVLAYLLLTWSAHVSAQVAIGEWRDHFPYRNAISVTEGGGKVYCATPSAVFSYHIASGEMERLTKINVLSDVNISKIRWNDALQILVVGYSNGNLDLIKGASSFNLNDIKQSTLVGDKGIKDIYFSGTEAYLSCGFGVVVIDLLAREVNETWLIGPGGTQLKVNDLTFHQDSVYAATDAGLYSAWANDPNLAAFSSWRKRLDLPTPNGLFNAVASFAGKLLVNLKSTDLDDDVLYAHNGSAWSVVTSMVGKMNKSFHVNEQDTILTIPHRLEASMLDAALAQVNSAWAYGSETMFPSEAIRSEFGYYWIADAQNGLARTWGGTEADLLFPNGPATTDARRIDALDGTVFVATGGVEGNWTNRFDKHGIFQSFDGVWGVTDLTNDPLMLGENTYGGAAVDMMCVSIDPLDETHAFAGSWDDGVLEFRGRDVVAIYNETNSSLAINDGLGSFNVVDIGGMDHDQFGNLWLTNPNTPEPIAVRTTSGSWRSFDPGNILNNNTLVSDILAAENGYKWVIRPRSNGLLVFNDNNTISNVSDDQYKLLNANEGQGGLPSIDVLSVAEDPDGEIWVGTNKGIAVFYNPEAIFSGSTDFDAQQILIEQDGNIQILLETEAISAIAVDGAGRKWLGTETSGVYLVSDDGQEQIHHFTTDNSPLPSNSITSIALDGSTGEVYFGTPYGIISYRSDATQGGFTSECLKVFPNPVRESYSGPIAINGLVRDSDLKITDVSGNLVYRTTSLGGQAIWPGTNMNGERVSTGVYLAFATDRDGLQKCMTKVLVVR